MYDLPIGVIKNYNAFVNGKNFNYQLIDSDTKQYKEIRKLKTAPGEDYSTGCLLDYEYIKIIIDWYQMMSQQKDLDPDSNIIHQIEFAGQ